VKLLILTGKPHSPSFRQRIGLYLDSLREKGVDCRVEALPAKTLCRWKLLRSALFFDGVLVQRKLLNWRDARLLRRRSKTIIYDFDDAVMYRSRSPDNKSIKRTRAFRRTMRIADLVIAGNPYLAEHARRLGASVEILPTGLRVSDYPQASHARDAAHARLVWIGSRSTLKYLDWLRPALQEAGRRINGLTLRIIADHFLDFQNVTVEPKAWSIETEGRDLADADIGIAPLPDDAFTRGKCGFKILQYMASALPVIASPVGVNAEYARDCGILATTHQQWTDAIESLARCRETRKNMGAEARRLAEMHYDQGVLAPRFCDLVIGALASRKDS